MKPLLRWKEQFIGVKPGCREMSLWRQHDARYLHTGFKLVCGKTGWTFGKLVHQERENRYLLDPLLTFPKNSILTYMKEVCEATFLLQEGT